MIKLHHLNESRSQRVLWFLEELGIDYEIVPYRRDPATRLAPPELKAIHPLGKSPVIQNGALVVAESGAILEYLARTYGKGRYIPAEGSADFIRHLHWMHFAEGSAMLPLMLGLYVGRLGEAGAPLHPRIDSEIANHLSYMEDALAGSEYFLGSNIMAVDFQLTFVLEAAKSGRRLDPYPRLLAYLDRVHARPAFKRALDRGGPYALGR